ncbi:MAG: RloB domain-containing protein [Deltaproteobacteria bacterium]|nr:RloB domain-containing protein [Deltaproteobacteria bacterium]
MPPKRRGHSAADLKRRRPRREPYDRVLVVCEGEKTERNYFRELCRHFRLSTANVEITPGVGNDPVSVVRTGKQLQKMEIQQGERYDRVYCVFDRDEHVNFTDACSQAQTAGFSTAVSNPAFEYWLLLHFKYIRAPFFRTGSRTAAQNCEHALKGELPGYSKGMQGLFLQLLPNLPDAKTRGARALADARQTGEEDPSTEVHELVAYLENLKDE